MRLPRMTTRRWMIVTAAVAAAFGIRSEIARRREMYRQHAVLLRLEEARAQNDLTIAAGDEIGWKRSCIPQEVDPEDPGLPAALGDYQRRVLYFRLLIHKYEYAARYPWLPVALDPLEPPKPRFFEETWIRSIQLSNAAEARRVGAKGDDQSKR